MEDRNEVKSVELIINGDGRIWINVDGVCIFRCVDSESITVVKSGVTTEHKPRMRLSDL